MRNKMLARRIAIAMLSAATVMTAAPVGAFAATTVSVESSNTKTADAKDGSTFKSVILSYRPGNGGVGKRYKRADYCNSNCW